MSLLNCMITTNIDALEHYTVNVRNMNFYIIDKTGKLKHIDGFLTCKIIKMLNIYAHKDLLPHALKRWKCPFSAIILKRSYIEIYIEKVVFNFAFGIQSEEWLHRRGPS